MKEIDYEIEALIMALTPKGYTPPPKENQAFLEAPDSIGGHSRYTCPNCGGDILNVDSDSMPSHCENAEEAQYEYNEGDARSVYCSPMRARMVADDDGNPTYELVDG